MRIFGKLDIKAEKNVMALWLLEARNDLEKGNNPWRPWYNKTFGMIIRADSEIEARKIAQDKRVDGDESREKIKNPWLSEEHSRCAKLLYEGEKKVILEDFMSG